MDQILIIEDDTGLNQGLCRALKSGERQVFSCLNLKTAREQLLCGKVSLVLLDINLPDGNGLDFLQELKTADPMLPVILLTANDTDMDIVAGLEQGRTTTLPSPFPWRSYGPESIPSCGNTEGTGGQDPGKTAVMCLILRRCSFGRTVGLLN